MILLASVRGSPGVTTLVLAVATWTPRPLVVEADPDGGVLAVRYGLGREPGLGTVASARSGAGASLLRHAQSLPGGLPVVVAPETAERAAHLWKVAGPHLEQALSEPVDGTLLVDGGRFRPGSPAERLAPKAAQVVLVCRPRAEDLVPASERLVALQSEGATAGLVLVGDGPYTPKDVSALGIDVLGVVPADRRGARILEHGGSRRAFRSSPLVRASRTVAERLAGPHRVPAEAQTVSAPDAEVRP